MQEQSFLELDLPRSHFDGVSADALLFHVPSQVLPPEPTHYDLPSEVPLEQPPWLASPRRRPPA